MFFQIFVIITFFIHYIGFLQNGEAVAVTQVFRWQEYEIRPVSLKTEEFHVL